MDGVHADLLTAFGLAIGGMVLGLTWFMLAQSPKTRCWTWICPLLALAWLAFAGVAAVMARLTNGWQTVVAVSVVLGLLWGSQCSWATSAFASTLRYVRAPAVHAVSLVVTGPCLAMWWASSMPEPPPLDLEGFVLTDSDVLGLQEMAEGPALTDRGRPIHLFKATLCAPTVPSAFLAGQERKILQSACLDGRLIRTDHAGGRYNCFGWVFTGGRYWICQVREVDWILEDNGYRPVEQPQANDLAIYRDADDNVNHVGLVRLVHDDGPVLVESKWGTLGRFIHLGDAWNNCTYYRSPARNGHLLQGIGSQIP